MYKERRLALAQLLPENAIALFSVAKPPIKQVMRNIRSV